MCAAVRHATILFSILTNAYITGCMSDQAPAPDDGISGGKADVPCFAGQRIVPPGTITASASWNECEIQLRGPVEVAAGVTLTLGTGTKLYFDLSGSLVVRGTIVADDVSLLPYEPTDLADKPRLELLGDGSVLERVVLGDRGRLVITGSNTRVGSLVATAEDWYVVVNGGKQTSLTGVYAIKTGAVGGIGIANDADVEISDSVITSTRLTSLSVGINVTRGGTLHLVRSLVAGFETGISKQSGVLTVDDSAIVNNGTGIATYGDPGDLPPLQCEVRTVACELAPPPARPPWLASAPENCPVITHSLIGHNESYGVRLGPPERLQIIDSVVEDNGDYGVLIDAYEVHTETFITRSNIRRNNWKRAPDAPPTQIFSRNLSGQLVADGNHWGAIGSYTSTGAETGTPYERWALHQVQLTNGIRVEPDTFACSVSPDGNSHCECTNLCEYPSTGTYSVLPAEERVFPEAGIRLGQLTPFVTHELKQVAPYLY